MKAIAVDDEIYMLETLQEAINASSDIDSSEAFSSSSAALAYAAENPVDVAFLDINRRGIGGLGLAEKLMEKINRSMQSKSFDFLRKCFPESFLVCFMSQRQELIHYIRIQNILMRPLSWLTEQPPEAPLQAPHQ